MITNRQVWTQNVAVEDVRKIGEVLRRKREEKRISLESVHGKTFLSLKYLKGVEEGDLSQFPAEVYYTSTLRHYAGFLGIDVKELMELYRKRAVQIKQEQPAREDTRSSKSLKIYFAVVLLAGAVVFALLLRARHSDENMPVPAPVQPPVAVSTQPVVTPPAVSTRTFSAGAVPKTATAPVTGAAPKAATAPVTAPVAAPKVTTAPATAPAEIPGNKLRLSIKMLETSWIKVIGDNRNLWFEGTLLAGSEKEWTARDKFYVVVGYAPGVQIKLNGVPIDATKGAQKDINQLTLTLDSIAAKR